MSLGPEKSVLSLMLQNPREFIPRAIGKRLKPREFIHPDHATIYKILLEEFKEGKQIALVALVQDLLDRGMISRTLTLPFLADLYTFAATPGHFDGHLMRMRGRE